jgi:transposase
MSTTIKERDREKLERRRIAAGRMFNRGESQYAVAHHFEVSTAATNQWYKAWKEDGEGGLKSKGPPGFSSKLTEQKKKELKNIILQGPRKNNYSTDFWTIDRIRSVVKKKLHITLGYTRIWTTVISLGFSCQKPIRRAKERDEKAITDWKLKRFPKLKKMGT